jgi:hypothetical protein
MTDATTVDSDLAQLQRRALIVGVVAFVLCAVGAAMNPAQFYQSYLVGYLFWIGIPLGSIGIIMLHHLVGGGWGFIIRRALESSMWTLPLMAVLSIPIIIGMSDLYLWAQPEVVANDEILQFKAGYLNPSGFIMRLVLYFVIWTGLGYCLSQWSLEQDRTGDAALTNRLSFISGPGLPVMALTITFSVIDWAMSLDPHWFSTLYGLLFVAGDLLATLAFGVCVVSWLGHKKPLSDFVTTTRIHDLGNLMLAFVMVWAYFSFSQYLIIWSANLPEEIPWYIHRTGPGWIAIAVFLLLFHFALPFTLLLSRRTKQAASTLMWVAGLVLVMRLVDIYWQVAPAFSKDEIHLHWLDLAAPIAIGGLWLAAFAWRLKTTALVPLQDPRFADLAKEEHPA